ncbi:MAG: coproporphyrinogen III oxidase [Cognaticolwellia sp.]|jgi:coproporphyrinogen III oxidase
MREQMHQRVKDAQDQITQALSAIDGQNFEETHWERPGGGGGRTRVLENGDVFEKAGVNTSAVHGELPEAAVASMRGKGIDSDERRFFATGLSLVLHPWNPHAPTVHLNYRYFELGPAGAPVAWWFGGGADLTPAYLYEEDAQHFHSHLKGACDGVDPALYPAFKKRCDDYFWLKHREEARGLGGIFYDDLRDRDPQELFTLADRCMSAFLPSYLPILERRQDMPFTDAERDWQLQRRGRYVEFNLVWDRGTLFGLRTGARVESVLMSLPLNARFRAEFSPEPGSREAEIQEVLRAPRDWI